MTSACAAGLAVSGGQLRIGLTGTNKTSRIPILLSCLHCHSVPTTVFFTVQLEYLLCRHALIVGTPMWDTSKSCQAI
ncbi:hypothetical protein M434DRAFT_344032 [Hypoxylon sp. CO27-5]|nr:hypothetical protein M434DRAFT_344032 [Hypoxylon sp. CO27-5]